MVGVVLSKLLQTVLLRVVRGVVVVLVGIICAISGTSVVSAWLVFGLVRSVAGAWSVVSVSAGSGFGTI